MQPHDVEVQAELAEVKHLQQQQLALALGLPGLQIEQLYGKQRQSNTLLLARPSICATSRVKQYDHHSK